jgi:hypothetical protein
VAKVVLGLGTSHSPMLSVPSKAWGERVPADQSISHPFNGKEFTFDDLVDLRQSEGLEAQITSQIWAERDKRNQDAIESLGDVFAETAPDVGLIVGNDQMEVFSHDHVPAFAVFWGDYVEGHPRSEEFLASLPPGVARAELDRTPKVYTEWPCLPELGRHVIESVMSENFDVAQITRLSTGEVGSNAAPHAYGFVYRRIMRDKVVPHVPVFVNTFYPPNQPTAKRCFEFGRALARAIDSWPEDKTVAVIGSGGLSHFVVNESVDRLLLDALASDDGKALAGISEQILQSGTSEMKNWITLAGIMSEAGLGMNLVDYVPCYRSLAGTGNAMGFAYWR